MSSNTIIGFHAARVNETVIIATSEGDIISEPPYVTQILNCSKQAKCIAYDLDQFVACLLYAIGITEGQGQRLIEKERLFVSPVTITFFPSRFFSLDYGGGRGHAFVNFGNANQVGYHDAKYSSEDSSIEDILGKAREAKNTAGAVDSILCKLGLPDSTLVSPSSTFLKKFSLNWPTFKDYPTEVQELSWQGICGQWFETYKLGSFEAWDYDVNASYLFELSKLLDTRKGSWIESTTPPDNAAMGITEGILTTDAPFHPFITKYTGSNYTPTGRFPAVMTLQSLQFLKRWDLGIFQAEKGHWWIPKSHYEVYKGTLMFLWNVRQGTMGRERLLIQRIYSALWGKMLQHSDVKGFGDRFDSFIGLNVEVNSRLHVAEACLQSGITDSLLAIMADGFISSEPASIPLDTNLGGWRLSTRGRCIISGTGMVAFEGKEQPAELAIDYTTLKQQIEKTPNASQYSRSAYSPVTLALALQQDWEKLGQVQKIERTLTIGTENKRVYLNKPQTGMDLITKTWDSLPWDYAELKMLHPAAKDNLTSSQEEAEVVE